MSDSNAVWEFLLISLMKPPPRTLKNDLIIALILWDPQQIFLQIVLIL